MCKFCETQPLIKAIDQLIALAEDDLTSELKDEGFADPQDTAKRVSKLEDELAEALMDETDYIVGEFKQCSSLDEADRKWGKITSGDTAAVTISAAFQTEFEEMMPQTIQYYLQQTDRSLKLTEVSQRTTSWVESWSKELGQIMQLNSQKEIESILTTGLKSGQGIDDFTRQIMQSGIRDEYYKARRAALTEVLRAHSVAQQEAFMQSPSVQSKRWRHTGSYRNEPRWNHMDIDGQIVRKDQPFTLAGADGGVYYPMYPRDSSLPPGESINCHCLSEPIVDDSILGLSLEEREDLQQQAIDEMNAQDAAEKAEAERREQRLADRRARREERMRQLEEERKRQDEEYARLRGERFVDSLKGSGIEYKEVKYLEQPLTSEQIIAKLGGEDATDGSCTSLALSYVANEHGLDVTDQRGGASQKFFSNPNNVFDLSGLLGVNSQSVRAYDSAEVTMDMIKNASPGEYVLSTGGHTAVINVGADGAAKYLELQDYEANGNGWHDLDFTELVLRFGCRYSPSGNDLIVMTEASSLSGTEKFNEIMGYINNPQGD